MPNELISHELSGKIETVSANSKALIVNSNDSRKQAVEFRQYAKQCKGAVIQFLAKMKQKTWEAYKEVQGTERNYTEKCEIAIGHINTAISKFDSEQERLRIKEERRLQAEADAKAKTERDKLLKRAEALKTPEKKQEALEAADAVATAPITVESKVQKVEGEIVTKTWKARITDITRVPTDFFIQHPKFVAVIESIMNGLASKTKGSLKVEGVEFYEETSYKDKT